MNPEITMAKVAVDMRSYNGNIHTILYGGKCPYTGKTEDECVRDGFTIMAWDEYMLMHDAYLNSLCGSWKELSADDYDEALNVLPPVQWYNGGFFMSECYMDDVTTFYQKWGDRYYSSLQHLSTERADIIKSLQNYLEVA